jgi:hypothetical protein
VDPREELAEVDMCMIHILSEYYKAGKENDVVLIASGDTNASSYAYFTYVLIL